MQDLIGEYQLRSEKVLSRNKNIMDILTKLQCANAKLARSAVKSATGCGCTSLSAGKSSGAGAEGVLCEDCADAVYSELGELMFYASSLCSALGLSLREVFVRDISRSDMMGSFSLR